MPVSIVINADTAAKAIAELRAVAQELGVSEAQVGECMAPATAPAAEPALRLVPQPETSSQSKPRGRPRKQTESSAPQPQPAASPPPTAAAPEVTSPPELPKAVAPTTPSPFDDSQPTVAAEVTDAQMRDALQKVALSKPGNDGLLIVAKIIKDNGGYERVRDIKAEDRAKIYAAALKAV